MVGWAGSARAQDSAGDDPQAPTPRPVAVEYSDAYYTRAKIHKYASFATLPLFATEVALGQTIYNDPNANSSAAKGAHIAVGTRDHRAVRRQHRHRRLEHVGEPARAGASQVEADRTAS